MKLIYLLSVHDEYGSEHVIVTEIEAALPALLHAHFYKGQLENEYTAALVKLKEVLQIPDPHYGEPYDLGRGWGGPQLHIVKVLEL